ncbi:TetR/AcrR family transcriptional regulator [Ursidibacter arcticus]|uniref:TetR/AcrR family transcriptional regulator n=1 Tax=Ursidibacter arcticus TaxID=1524965 RepID=UPI0012F9C907|nr:TetR/AcrR family transcriptional regulator [Ursidibacter arcticus]KAE9534581.1 AcrR family transcriptional regulator [Ursidibacter arcticus]
MIVNNVPHNEVALRILNAADTLMAENGVQYLSTHKIAKQAGVSVGTIYLYFKDKDDLLNQLVIYLFGQFNQAIEKQYDETLPLFEQYRALWLAKFEFMSNNLNIVKNMYQYESLPQFRELLRHCFESEHLPWNRFIKRGLKQGVIVDLPLQILYAMSMKVPQDLIYQQLSLDKVYSQQLIEDVILRTWKAIIV